MKTSPVTPADLRRSVLAVPPLARDDELELAEHPNRRMLQHLEAGGVTTIIYGGNANLYNIGARQYRQLLERLPEWASEDAWLIPSLGPSFGQLMDGADVVRETGYPTAMALPLSGPATQAGTATGLRKAAERAGRPLVLYLKWDGYLDTDLVAELVNDGTVCAIKYAVVRQDPADDDALRALVDAIGPERVVSGIGERPAVVHLRDFGLPAFTSGSVCVAPRRSDSGGRGRSWHVSRYYRCRWI
jgi:dihydrodipicolinate synthase/N-acetylneuraminate lyase